MSRGIALTVAPQALPALGLLFLATFACGEPLGELRSERLANRLYHGAPPTIPHKVDEWGRYGCNQCHGDGVPTIADRSATVTPHPQYTNCRQCHATPVTGGLFRRSDFVAYERPVARPPKANPLGPPHIPHRVQDREDCAACHIQDRSKQALVPRHGPRSNCTQCHVAQDVRAEGFPRTTQAPGQ